MRHVSGTALSRRRMLAACAGVVALPPVLASCTSGTGSDDGDPAALLALADQARADAALVVAAVTADPGLSGRLEPLRAARIAHAGALDTAGGRTTPPPETVSGAAPQNVDLGRIRDAVTASARSAAQAVAGTSVSRVGLVAEVAACCAAYATVLT
ncbi:hypothetical protein [Pseudonocardia endophytica]|uniref:Uncharacterized protein n=1 Tax=Pseudonocardia endophytica TaxID=401976 RepID=A0A4R1HX38_PSEEN|nr:hypothetical protein [Pseudonocardia endophytica]TCK25360.1 hypothetical protein EV378_1166 [Pseudonocardia endophytica]